MGDKEHRSGKVSAVRRVAVPCRLRWCPALRTTLRTFLATASRSLENLHFTSYLSLENDVLKEQHPSMPINQERQARVTFGGTKKD